MDENTFNEIKNSQIPFAQNRKYISVGRLKEGFNYLKIDSNLNYLSNFIDPKHKDQINELIKRCKQLGYIAQRDNTTFENLNFETLWNEIGYLLGRKKIRTFLVNIGIDAVFDMGTGSIHHNEKNQLYITNTNCFNFVKQFNNRREIYTELKTNDKELIKKIIKNILLIDSPEDLRSLILSFKDKPDQDKLFLLMVISRNEKMLNIINKNNLFDILYRILYFSLKNYSHIAEDYIRNIREFFNKNYGINESRKIDRLNQSHKIKNPIESLEKYVDIRFEGGLCRYFIHFTDIEGKLGINPRPNVRIENQENWPLGIYAYPLSGAIYNQLLKQNIDFAGDRKFISIGEFKDGFNYKFITSYHAYTEDVLGDVPEEIYKEIFLLAFDEEFYNFNPDDYKEFSRLWHTFSKKRVNYIKSGFIFRKLGIDAIFDLGNGVIHPNEKSQVYITNTRCFDFIGQIENSLRNYKDEEYIYSDSIKNFSKKVAKDISQLDMKNISYFFEKYFPYNSSSVSGDKVYITCIVLYNNKNKIPIEVYNKCIDFINNYIHRNINDIGRRIGMIRYDKLHKILRKK